jgi:cell division protein FtsB
MVRNTRIRSALTHAGLWTLIAALTGYFVYHGIHGERGLRAHRSFDAEIAALSLELAELKAVRTGLEQRVGRLEPSSVDRDLLDEVARQDLGWLHPNDRILDLSK